MRNSFNEYFSFSRRERRGLIVLLIIIAGVIITNILVQHKLHSRAIDFSQYEKTIDNWYNSDSVGTQKSDSLFYFDPNTATIDELCALGLKNYVAKNIISYREKGGKFKNPNDLSRIYGLDETCFERILPYMKIKSGVSNTTQKHNKQIKELHQFDPNTVSRDTLISIGFKPWLADNLIKYRSNGGVFKEKSDLGKLYGLDTSFYNKLKPYIQINDSFTTPSISTTDSLIVNLNTADANELMKIRGIGPSYSERIITYREKLGGYVSYNQLLEVYGLDDEIIDKIKNHLIIDTNNIDCININTADFTTLIRHPYLNKQNVQAILNYRKLIGNFNNKSELLNQKVLIPEVYNKISPYLCTE